MDPSVGNSLWSMNPMDMPAAMPDGSAVDGMQQQQQQQQSGGSPQQNNMFPGPGNAFMGVGAANGNGMM